MGNILWWGLQDLLSYKSILLLNRFFSNLFFSDWIFSNEFISPIDQTTNWLVLNHFNSNRFVLHISVSLGHRSFQLRNLRIQFWPNTSNEFRLTEWNKSKSFSKHSSCFVPSKVFQIGSSSNYTPKKQINRIATELSRCYPICVKKSLELSAFPCNYFLVRVQNIDILSPFYLRNHTSFRCFYNSKTSY